MALICTPSLDGALMHFWSKIVKIVPRCLFEIGKSISVPLQNSFESLESGAMPCS